MRNVMEKLSLTRQEIKPGRDQLFNTDVSTREGSSQATSVALEHTIQFNASVAEINTI